MADQRPLNVNLQPVTELCQVAFRDRVPVACNCRAISCLLEKKSMRPSKILPLIVPIQVEKRRTGIPLQVSWTMLLLRESYKLSVSISS
jgi:hypothetical protein